MGPRPHEGWEVGKEWIQGQEFTLIEGQGLRPRGLSGQGGQDLSP